MAFVNLIAVKLFFLLFQLPTLIYDFLPSALNVISIYKIAHLILASISCIPYANFHAATAYTL